MKNVIMTVLILGSMLLGLLSGEFSFMKVVNDDPISSYIILSIFVGAFTCSVFAILLKKSCNQIIALIIGYQPSLFFLLGLIAPFKFFTNYC
jgi:hypothetical protein